MAIRVARWWPVGLPGQVVSGVTPFPSVAWVSRMESPVVATRWAWWRSRPRSSFQASATGASTHITNIFVIGCKSHNDLHEKEMPAAATSVIGTGSIQSTIAMDDYNILPGKQTLKPLQIRTHKET